MSSFKNPVTYNTSVRSSSVGDAAASIVLFILVLGLFLSLCNTLYINMFGDTVVYCGTLASDPQLVDPSRGNSYVLVTLEQYPSFQFTASKDYVHLRPGTHLYIEVQKLASKHSGVLRPRVLYPVDSCG